MSKVKLSSSSSLISLENKAFYGTVLALASSTVRPSPQFTPFFIATRLPKTSSYNHRFNCVLTWNISNRVGHCLHANSTRKRHSSAATHQNLKQPHAPGIYPRYPKCISDDSPVSVQQHDIQLDTKPPQFEGDTEL